MKKSFMLFAVLMLLCAFTLAGCGDDKKKDAVPENTDSNNAEVTEVAATEETDTKEESEEIEEAAEEEVIAEDTKEELADRRTDIQKYWNGDWYGWVSFLATGDYKEFNDTKYDTCGRIEVDEKGDGTLTLWYGYEDGDTYASPTGVIDIHIDDTIGGGSHGTLISTGGWMFVEDYRPAEVEEGEIYVKPDEKTSIDCVYINYEMKDENGSIKPMFALRPWGYTWQDDSYYENMDHLMPGFFEWYTALIEEGWAQPDDFSSKPVKTMQERKQELIELAAGQDTPVRTDADEYNEFFVQLADVDTKQQDSDTTSADESNSDAYYNDSKDFENELGSSRITHGFEKEIGNPTVKGKAYSWGNLSVNIPDGMEAKNGGIANKDDENSLQILKGTKYFIVSQRYELDALDDVLSTTELNDADEIAITIDKTVWEGAYYEYSGSPVWQIYTNIGEACIEVMGYGFDFDSAETQTVLATVKSTKLLWE